MPSTITITDIWISTSKLSTMSNNSWEGSHEIALFEFYSADDVVIENMTIDYSYDMTQCVYSGVINNGYIDGNAEHWICTNPVILIKNDGQIQMNHIQIMVHRTERLNDSMNDEIHNVVDYETGGAFIINYETMKIEQMRLQDTLSSSLIFNRGTLSVDGLYVEKSINDSLDINDLRSDITIEQRGSSAALVVVSDSHFVGGHWAIHVMFSVHVISKFFT